MHAGVFRARISEVRCYQSAMTLQVISTNVSSTCLLQEAFQILLNVMESHFAALKLPSENHNADEVIIPAKPALIASKIFLQGSSRSKDLCSITSCTTFVKRFSNEDNCYTRKIRVSQLTGSNNLHLSGAVWDILVPLSRPLSTIRWSDHRSIDMEGSRSPNRSQEPMDIEEISFTEPACLETFVQNVRRANLSDFDSSDTDMAPSICGSYRQPTIRESKLTNVVEASSEAKIITNKEGVENKKVAQKFVERPEYAESKMKLRSLSKKKPDKPEGERTTIFYFWQMLFFILFPIAVVVTSVCVARDDFFAKDCAHEFDPTAAISAMENRVFGQARAIKELGAHLELNSSQFKVIALIGGSGIGKSYAVHIIQENFSKKTNIFQYVPPLESQLRHVSGVLSMCGCNLVVLENLSNRDVSETARFVERIRAVAENRCVLIIGVINIQETDDDLKHKTNVVRSTAEIVGIYRDRNVEVEVVAFDPLDDEAITKCITEAATHRNITLSKRQIEDIAVSLRVADSGCKGAYAKVQLL